MASGVTSIGTYAFLNCVLLPNLVIPNTVASIGSNVFQGCSVLSSVTLPTNPSFTSLAASTFQNCGALTSVIIPSSVTSIASAAFSSCSKLRSVSFLGNAPSVVAGAFTSVPAAGYYLNTATGWSTPFDSLPMTSVTSMAVSGDFNYVIDAAGAKVISYVGTATTVSIPSTLGGSAVTSIGGSAFLSCTLITSVTIPSGVTSIGDKAFKSNSALTNVTIPSTVTSIGASAFYSCARLGGFYFLGNAPTLGLSAFTNTVAAGYYLSSTTGWSNPYGDLTMTGVTIMATAGDYTYVDAGAGAMITGYSGAGGAVTAPSTLGGRAVNSIGSTAFLYKTSLTSMTIPSGVTSIGSMAFVGCTSLTATSIPSTVTSIGSTAFYNCTVLANVTLPRLLTSIEASTFQGCRSLTVVTIPSAVTSIGAAAFYGCTGLTAVYFQGDAPTGITGIFTSVTAPGYRASAATGWTSTYYGLTMTAQSRPTVTTPTSASVATSTATLGGTVTAAGDTSLLDVGVVYAPTASNPAPQLDGTSVTNLTSTAATGVMALSATGLTAGTEYSYAAYATNSVGTTYTSVAAITTGPVPTLTFATPTAATVTNGATLSNTATSTLSGAGYGAISYTSGALSIATVDAATGLVTAVSAGTTTITATQALAAGYNNTGSNTYVLTVGKATPTVTWATPSAITYGTALSATQLNATGSVPGTIVYSPASGTTPSVGTSTLTATFTPTDTANYDGASGTVSLIVNKATPTVTWATPSAITYGTALSATQLNATGSVPGTIVYSPASGTTPSVGTSTLTATFTPTDTANYNGASRTVSLVVSKATPTVTWETPSGISYGNALSETQLNATASVAVAIVYSPASGTTPGVGTSTLTATFTPTDTANYNGASGTVSLVVSKATPSLTWATPSAITYGTALSATQLNATASVAGAIVYSPASGTTPSVGTQTLTATFTPTDTANYDSASASVALAVVVAAPGAPTAISATTANGEATVTFTAPSNTGSSAITSFTICATATDGSTVSVTATGSPAKITGLTPGKSYSFTVTANNSAGSSDTSTPTDELTISLLNQTITFPALADREHNSGSFALSATTSLGLPVTYTIMSGPALLTGNIVDLTGALGPVLIRASQAGNATCAAAPDVEASFLVTEGLTRAIFSKVINPATQKPEADLVLVLQNNSSQGTLMIGSTTTQGLNGVVAVELGAAGVFIAELKPYTITGSLTDNVLSGTVAPLGLTFRAVVVASGSTPSKAVGFYAANALGENRGSIYAAVGANNEVLLLTENDQAVISGLTTLKADNTLSFTTTTATGSAIITGDINPVTTVINGVLTLANNPAVSLAGLSVATTHTDRLINLSSRAKVGPGEAVLITGFVVGGSESKRVLIRAVGPALGAFGLANTLPNPAIKIYRGSNLIAQNDDWNPADAAEMARLGAFSLLNIRGKEATSNDAALFATLAPGAYTALITDPSGTGTGVALAEIYDASVNPNADYQRLVNISSRGKVTPDDGVLIGGFIVTGNAPKTLLIRGVGPTLTAFGIAGALADPALTIYRDSKVIATNEGWANSAAIATAAIQTGAFTLPSGSKDAAVLVTLNPGAYTALIKSAKNASSGVALIEIYEVP